MALKSIVEIDIDDTKFKEWLDKAHKLTLGVNPSSATPSTTTPSSAPSTVDKKINSDKEKEHNKDKRKWVENDNHYRRENKARKDSLEELTRFSRAVFSTSKSLAKWGIGLSVAGAAGVAGVTGVSLGYLRGAKETTDEFRRSKQLGVNVGQMKSLEDALSPLFDVKTTLANFAEAATDLDKKVSLGLLSPEERKKSPAEMMLAMIPKLKQELTKVGGSDTALKQYMEANKITDLFSMDDIKSLKNNSSEFISSLMGLAKQNKEALSLTDDQQQEYAKLNVNYTLAVDKFTQDLKKATVGLAPEITKLITEFSGLAHSGMESGAFRKAIIKLGDGLVDISDYISSGKLLNTLKDFESGLKSVTDFFGWTTNTEDLGVSESNKTLGGDKNLPRNLRNYNPGNVGKGDWANQHGAIGDDGTFAIFPDMETGKKAQTALLEKYMREGNDTISEIINKWSPATGKGNTAESTQNYINDVVKKTGIDPNKPLTKDQIEQVRASMEYHEGHVSGSADTFMTHDYKADIAANNKRNVAQFDDFFGIKKSTSQKPDITDFFGTAIERADKYTKEGNDQNSLSNKIKSFVGNYQEHAKEAAEKQRSLNKDSYSGGSLGALLVNVFNTAPSTSVTVQQAATGSARP